MATAALSPAISQESIDQIRTMLADETRSGITTATGLQGYELEAPAKVIVPIVTPLVNMLPRKPGSGYPVCHWKAITSFDTGRSDGTLVEGQFPSYVTYATANMSNTYKTLALANSVTFDAQWTGRALEGDVRARRVAELLYQLKMTEERWLIGASQNLFAPATPILSTATTGGSVAAGTYHVEVTALSGTAEGLPSGYATIVTTGTTSTITIQIFTIPFATGYNVYISSSGVVNANFFIQPSVSGNTNAAQPGYNASVTLNGGGSTVSGEVVAPFITVTLTAAVATSGANPPASAGITRNDGSGNPMMFDGLLAQAVNNATTANGLTLGAQVAQPAAATGVLALSDIQNMLTNAYNQAVGDPDFLIMHPSTATKLTNLVVASGQTRYVVEAKEPEQSGKLTANYRVTHYLNEATGKELPIIQDRYCPMDSIIGLPMTIPFPSPEINAAIEIETNREYWGVDFAVTTSAYQFADYVNETLKVYFLGGLCLLRGIVPAS